MSETARAPADVFEKARGHDRKEQLEAAKEADLLPYFRLLTSEAGPVVEMEGRETIMLGSNNYLGLTGDPRVKAAAREALDRYGTALTGSRLLNGTIPLHVELEREIAEWMGTEDAIVFTTGYQANLGTIGTILGPGDTVICDSGDHASILDGCRLSGAKLRPFRHNQMDKLEKMLERASADGGGALVVVDGVFSMEGDICPLPEIVELTERHGARLMVDEAHAVGVLGERGAGVCELYGLEDRVDLRMGTFSKSLASCGGYVAGPADVIEYLRISARAFVFTAAAVPASLGAALEAVRICRREGRPLFARLLDNAAYLRRGFGELGLAVVEPGRLPDGSRGDHPGGPGRRRRGLAGGVALEGAVRGRRLHERRASSRGPAGWRAASHQPDGDPRARPHRPRAGDLRQGDRGLPGTTPLGLARSRGVGPFASPLMGSFALSIFGQAFTEHKKLALSERPRHRRGVPI